MLKKKKKEFRNLAMKHICCKASPEVGETVFRKAKTIINGTIYSNY